MSFIYRATNKKNGKCYIGRTNYEKLRQRIATHKWYANNVISHTPFPNALRKYGIEGFDWDILEECNKDVVGEREIYWIEELNPYYNVTKGGDGGRSGIPCPEHVKEASRKARSKPVRCIDTGVVYENARLADEATPGASWKGISAVCRGRREKHAGLRWEFLNSGS